MVFADFIAFFLYNKKVKVGYCRMEQTKLKGNLILLLTALVWGMAFAFQSQGSRVLPPFSFTAARMSLAAIEVTAFAIWLDCKRGFFRKPERNAAGASKPDGTGASDFREYIRTTIKAGIVCGLAMLGGTVFQQIGVTYTSAGKAGFITAMYILIVPIIASVVLKKAPGLRIWTAVAIGVIGMYLLCMGSPEGLAKGDIYVIICALFFSVQITLIDSFGGRADPVKIAALEFIVISVICWVIALLIEKPDAAGFVKVIVPILYCGCVSGGLGYTLQIVGQQYTDPTSGALCMSFESVFAVVGGALILGQHMTQRELLGAAIMFLAIVLVQLPDRKK